MKVTTSRDHRAVAFKAIGPDRFETAADYFYFIHLNDTLRWIHAWSFLAASVIFGFSIARMSLGLFVLQYLVSTIPAVLSHYFCDGFVNTGPAQRPAWTLRMGIGMNIKYLTNQLHQEDSMFLQKYPFVRSVFEMNPYLGEKSNG